MRENDLGPTPMENEVHATKLFVYPHSCMLTVDEE